MQVILSLSTKPRLIHQTTRLRSMMCTPTERICIVPLLLFFDILSFFFLDFFLFFDPLCADGLTGFYYAVNKHLYLITVTYFGILFFKQIKSLTVYHLKCFTSNWPMSFHNCLFTFYTSLIQSWFRCRTWSQTIWCSRNGRLPQPSLQFFVISDSSPAHLTLMNLGTDYKAPFKQKTPDLLTQFPHSGCQVATTKQAGAPLQQACC